MSFGRRACLQLAGVGGVALLSARSAQAFGESAAFNPRLLLAGNRKTPAWADSAAARWAWELLRRTSAPARLVPSRVSADRAELWSEPFAIWCGDSDVGSLSNAELRGMTRFFRLGGVLLVDDAAPANGSFGRSARREIARVLPDSPPVRLDSTHVLFKAYYLLDRPVGRSLGAGHLDAIVRGKNAQVLFSDFDLLGALARNGDTWAFEVEPGGSVQRERAARLCVNIAMYLLCSDYKDDQVHAEWLMRRRANPRR
ncbi:MAG: DUF4159 domain-containing protein [Myxococcota bacterium]